MTQTHAGAASRFTSVIASGLVGAAHHTIVPMTFTQRPAGSRRTGVRFCGRNALIAVCVSRTTTQRDEPLLRKAAFFQALTFGIVLQPASPTAPQLGFRMATMCHGMAPLEIDGALVHKSVTRPTAKNHQSHRHRGQQRAQRTPHPSSASADHHTRVKVHHVPRHGPPDHRDFAACLSWPNRCCSSSRRSFSCSTSSFGALCKKLGFSSFFCT